jgi:hypothetical protein
MKAKYERRISIASVAIIFILALTGVSRDNGQSFRISIDQPLAGQVYRNAPDINIQFRALVVPDDLKIRLNGVIITDFARKTERNQVRIIGRDVKKYLKEGQNWLIVRSRPGKTSLIFEYDSQGPKVKVEEITESGDSLVIKGIGQDSHQVSRIEVNGMPANLRDNHFEVIIPKCLLVTFETTDQLGNTRTEQFARPGLKIQSGAGSRINRTGLSQAISRLTLALMEKLNITGRIMSASPILERKRVNPITGEEVSALSLTVDSLTHDDLALDFDLVPPDSLQLLAKLRGMNVIFRAKGHLFDQTFDTPVSFVVPEVEISPLVALRGAVEGRIRTLITDITTTLPPVEMDFGLLPDEFKDTVRDAIYNRLSELISMEWQENAPAQIESFFSTLEATAFSMDWGNATSTLRSQIGAFTVDSNGINFQLDADVMADLGPDVQRRTIGSQFDDSHVVDWNLATELTDPTGAQNLFTFNENSLNRALLADYLLNHGQVNLTLPIDLLRQDSDLTDLYPQLGTNMKGSLLVTATLREAPALSFGRPDQAGITLSLAELDLTLKIKDQSGSIRDFVSVKTDVHLGLDVDPSGRTLKFLFGQPAYNLAILSSGMNAMSYDSAASAVGLVLPSIIEQLSQIFRGISLPRLEGIHFQTDGLIMPNENIHQVILGGHFE